MAAGRVVGKEFREDSAAAASSAAANVALGGSSGYANPLAVAAGQGSQLTPGRKQSPDVVQLKDGTTVALLPANAHNPLYGRPPRGAPDVERLPVMPMPPGFGREDDVKYAHLTPESHVKLTILAAPPARPAPAASSSSASASTAAAAAGGVQSLPDPSSIRDPYNYVQRRGVPPKKDRTWGGDVMYYPGVSYLYGLGGGCVYGLVTVPPTAGLPLKLRFNSWINAMGRHGSRMANGFGCTAVFYATYKHVVQSLRGDRIDQWNSIAGAGLAVSTFFVPKGKTYMAVGGVAAATTMAAVEFGLQHPTVQQYQRRTYNAWKRTALYKNLFGDK